MHQRSRHRLKLTFRRKHRAKLDDNGFGNDFLGITHRHRKQKVKIYKLNFMKMKNFHASEDYSNRVKRKSLGNICKLYIW